GAKGFGDHDGHSLGLVPDDFEVAQGTFAGADLLFLKEEERQLSQCMDWSQEFMAPLSEIEPPGPLRSRGRLSGCRTARFLRCSLEVELTRDCIHAHVSPSLWV